jgi:hypothetical protein
MASGNLNAQTEMTDPIGSDEIYVVDDPNGVPADRKLYLGNLNTLGQGYMVNGKLNVTVASNNITVALKTLSGGNPSATDPVSIWINGSYRRVTAALSVTKNAGTNWFASGAAELATKEIDYFVYLLWNTTPVTDIVDIGFARIPYGRVYSDFSTTTTNEKYMAFGNASTPTSTDDVVLIGRFAATLSASASYNWSVPTFTNSNLVNHPIYSTRWLSWTPTITGYSANPTNALYRYRMEYDTLEFGMIEGTAGTSNATSKTYTMPFAVKTLTNLIYQFPLPLPYDNTTNKAAGVSQISSGSATMTMYLSAAGAWTGSGSAALYTCKGAYEI